MIGDGSADFLGVNLVVTGYTGYHPGDQRFGDQRWGVLLGQAYMEQTWEIWGFNGFNMGFNGFNMV